MSMLVGKLLILFICTCIYNIISHNFKALPHHYYLDFFMLSYIIIYNYLFLHIQDHDTY